MGSIHPFAIVSERAHIGQGVSVGPFCVIEEGTVIGDGCTLASHVIVKEGTRIGSHNQICEGAVLGGRPQHLRAGQQVGTLEIGDANQVRENVTIHCGLAAGKSTVVGSHNLIMVSAHVGHDCQIGSHTILANNVMLGGHVTVEDFAYLSGAVAVHQFCRIGQHAMVGGQAHLTQDVPPYVMVDGASSRVVGLNRIGLRRRQFSDAEMLQIKMAYRAIYRSGLRWEELIELLQSRYAQGRAAAFHSFLCVSQRGIIQERRGSRMATLKLTGAPQDGEASQELRKAG